MPSLNKILFVLIILFLFSAGVRATKFDGGFISGTNTVCNAATVLTFNELTCNGATHTITGYQWEQWNSGSSTWGNVIGGSGSTTATYTTPILNSNIYYRVIITFTGSVCSSQTSPYTISSYLISSSPVPTTATAGPDQALGCGNGTTLAANTPLIGTGSWSIITGYCDFEDVDSPTTTITNVAGTTTLRWSISSGTCSPSTDDVVITSTSNAAGGYSISAATCYNSATTLILTNPVGTIQWEESGDAGNTDAWTNVVGGSGGTTSSYTTPVLSDSIFYRAHLTGGSCGDVYTNAIYVTIGSDSLTEVWQGAVSTNWFDSANWCIATPNAPTVDVIIPANTPYSAIITGITNINCKDLTVQEGASFEHANSGDFRISGNFINNGMINHSGSVNCTGSYGYWFLMDGASGTMGGSGDFTNVALSYQSPGVFQLANDIDMYRTWVNTGADFSLVNYTLKVSDGFDMYADFRLGSGTLEMGANSINSIFNETFWHADSGTVFFNRSSLAWNTIPAVTYYNLKIANFNGFTNHGASTGTDTILNNLELVSGTSGGTYQHHSGTLTVLGDVLIDAGTTFNLEADGASLIVEGNLTIDGTLSGDASSLIQVSGNWVDNGNFAANDSKVKFVGEGNTTIYGDSSYIPTSSITIINEGFNGALPSAPWAVETVSGSGTLTSVATSSFPSGYSPTEGSGMLRFDSYTCSAGSENRLKTPAFSTIGYDGVQVNFDWLVSSDWPSAVDKVMVEYSLDGVNWTLHSTITRYATSNTWTSQSINLPPVTGNQSVVYLSFLFHSDYGNDCYLDNLQIKAANYEYIQGENFHAFEINKSGGGKVICNGKICVNDTLIFTNGIIETDTHKVVIQNQGFASIGSDASHVNGNMAIQSTSTVKKTLSVGNGTIMRPISITPSTADNTTFCAAYRDSSYTSTAVSNLHHIYANEYWEISRTGVTTPSPAQVELSWNSSNIVQQTDSLAVGSWNGTTWGSAGSENISGTNAAGTITSTSAWNEFNLFTLASKDCYNFVNSPMTASISSSVNASCYGSTDGQATATANGGLSPYSYLWSNGSTTQVATNLLASYHTVTISDGVGCAFIDAVTIGYDAASITITPSSTLVTCGAQDGSASVSVNGGTTPLTYLWEDGSTTSTASNLGSGPIGVSVTDALGCLALNSITVSNSSALAIITFSNTSPSCTGGNDGIVIGNVSGGTTPFIYTWSNGASGNTTTALVAGNYGLTVVDGGGCSYMDNTDLTDHSPTNVNLSATQASCADNDGSIVSNGSGGVTPYGYFWSSGASTGSITSLSGGPYQITMTDANGCTAVASSTITIAPSTISISTSYSTPTCAGDSDGSITVTVNGGISPYSYAWSHSGTVFSATANGLVANPYSITITDNIGCKANTTAIVTPAYAVDINFNKTNATCTSNNGSATAIVALGTTPYTYQWNDSNTQLTDQATDLTAGSYTVTVTDANSCSNQASVTVNSEPGTLAATYATSPTLCTAAFGTAGATATLGASSYSYQWSNGATTNTIGALIEGDYGVTITDTTGCIISSSLNVSATPSSVTITTNSTAASCGIMDGTASAVPGGGSTPFTYSWSNLQTTSTATGLGSGNHIISVTDNYGCVGVGVEIVPNSSGLGATVSGSTGASCFGGADGTITVSATGGTSPYAYLWSSGTTTSNNTGLIAANYTVSISDAGGCDFVLASSVSEPSIVSHFVASTDASCYNSNDGIGNITTSGGTAPYTYLWNTSATTNNITQLVNGNYTVTILDANNCQSIESLTISQPSAVTITSALANPSCNGQLDGTVSSTSSGGQSPYSYTWNSSLGLTFGPIVNGLGGETIALTVTDANACNTIETNILIEPLSISISITIDAQIDCFNGCDGQITAIANGGNGGFNYAWNNGAGSSTTSGLCAATYNVTCTDTQGCVITAIETLGEPAEITLALGSTNVSCDGLTDGEITVVAIGGNTPYSYEWSQGSSTSVASELSSGSYGVTVQDVNGCEVQNSSTILSPSIDDNTLIGQITLPDGSPVTEGTIMLFYDVGNTAWDTAATVSIDPNGNYSLSGLMDGNYIALAIPETGLYPNAFATYSNGAFMWDSAQAIILDCGSTTTLNFELTLIATQFGPGQISGTVYEVDGSGKQGDPIPGLSVVLQKSPGGLWNGSTTDNLGKYAFNDLPIGEYHILLDYPGLPLIDGYTVNITAIDTLFGNMNMFVDKDLGIYTVDPNIGIAEIATTQEAIAFPNPFRKSTTINFPNDEHEEVLFALYNNMGQVVQMERINSARHSINAQDLASGTYFFKLMKKNEIYEGKVVVE